MPVPLRHPRAHPDDLPGNRFRPTTWELGQQDRSIATATALFVQFGRIGLGMNSLASAMRMSPRAPSAGTPQIWTRFSWKSLPPHPGNLHHAFP